MPVDRLAGQIRCEPNRRSAAAPLRHKIRGSASSLIGRPAAAGIGWSPRRTSRAGTCAAVRWLYRRSPPYCGSPGRRPRRARDQLPPVPLFLPERGAAGLLVVLDRIVDDQQVRAPAGDRPADARSRHAAVPPFEVPAARRARLLLAEYARKRGECSRFGTTRRTGQ